MGLTAEDVKKNHNLARALVAYHTVLGVAAGALAALSLQG
jgi:hypothetical protein